MSAPARSSAPCVGPLSQAPSLSTSSPWRRRMVAFLGADFLPLRSTGRGDDATRPERRGVLVHSCSLCPQLPRSAPPAPAGGQQAPGLVGAERAAS